MKYTMMKNKVTGERFIRIKGEGDVYENVEKEKYDTLRKKAKKNLAVAQKDEMMRACGLTKAKGMLGGTYWE